MMAVAVSRFSYCDKRFYPYLEKILNQLPDDMSNDILGDEKLQLISDENHLSAASMNFTFTPEVNYLIYLNTSILDRPVLDITYAIANELAIYLVNKQGADEKSKDDKVKQLLVDWEIIMDLDRIRPADPIEKSSGYRIGYEWARRQKLDDLLWNYKEYFDEWYEERISPERFEQLYIDVAPFSILEQMQEENQDDEVKDKDAQVNDTLEAEIIWGLMAAVKELIHDES